MGYIQERNYATSSNYVYNFRHHTRTSLYEVKNLGRQVSNSKAENPGTICAITTKEILSPNFVEMLSP